MSVCRYWTQRGTCFYGNKCNYVHPGAENAIEGAGGNEPSAAPDGVPVVSPAATVLAAVDSLPAEFVPRNLSAPATADGGVAEAAPGRAALRVDVPVRQAPAAAATAAAVSSAPSFGFNPQAAAWTAGGASSAPSTAYAMPAPAPEPDQAAGYDLAAQAFYANQRDMAAAAASGNGVGGGGVGGGGMVVNPYANGGSGGNPYAGSADPYATAGGNPYAPGGSANPPESGMDPRPQYGVPGGYGGDYYGNPVVATMGGQSYYLPPGAVDPHGQPLYLPLPTNLYTTGLPHVPRHQHQRHIMDLSVNEELRIDMIKRNAIKLAHVDYDDPANAAIPRSLKDYHTFFPLDDPTRPQHAVVFGFPTTLYKAVSMGDGKAYAVRRVHNFHLENEYAISVVESWRRIRHPNVVGLYEAFTTKEWGDSSLVFIYDLHPNSQTLEQLCFFPNAPLSEPQIWAYITQVVSGLRCIHAAGLACRVLAPSKILVTSKNRIRLNCCGMFDVINFEGINRTAHYQQEDIFALGKLILIMACASPSVTQNIGEAIKYVSVHYSADLKNLVLFLLTKHHHSGVAPSIDEVTTMISRAVMTQLEQTQVAVDSLEEELSKELENGRIARLLIKLGCINERPEYDLRDWSENDNQYLLKLFRDYVFHQVHADGSPNVDFGHIVDSINKLDVGHTERISLASRDEQNLLVVRYRDLKRCVETSFQELLDRGKKAKENAAAASGAIANDGAGPSQYGAGGPHY